MMADLDRLPRSAELEEYMLCVLRECAASQDVPVLTALCRTKRRPASMARALWAAAIRERLRISTVEIAGLLGVDHSAIVHGARRVRPHDLQAILTATSHLRVPEFVRPARAAKPPTVRRYKPPCPACGHHDTRSSGDGPGRRWCVKCDADFVVKGVRS